MTTDNCYSSVFVQSLGFLPTNRANIWFKRVATTVVKILHDVNTNTTTIESWFSHDGVAHLWDEKIVTCTSQYDFMHFLAFFEQDVIKHASPNELMKSAQIRQKLDDEIPLKSFFEDAHRQIAENDIEKAEANIQRLAVALDDKQHHIVVSLERDIRFSLFAKKNKQHDHI